MSPPHNSSLAGAVVASKTEGITSLREGLESHAPSSRREHVVDMRAPAQKLTDPRAWQLVNKCPAAAHLACLLKTIGRKKERLPSLSRYPCPMQRMRAWCQSAGKYHKENKNAFLHDARKCMPVNKCCPAAAPTWRKLPGCLAYGLVAALQMLQQKGKKVDARIYAEDSGRLRGCRMNLRARHLVSSQRNGGLACAPQHARCKLLVSR